MRPVRAVSAPSAPKEFLDIKPGDRVSVEMTDGRRDSFKVQTVEGDVLISEGGQRYTRAEMRQLQHRRFSHIKTWSLVAGVSAGFVFWGIAMASGLVDVPGM
jgi:hypothetical protein